MVGDPGSDLGGGNYAKGYAINASGQVAGVANNHAFRTTATGLVSDPGADLGPGLALGINDSGQVTGATPGLGSFGHAFRTTANGYVNDPGANLGTLGGAWSVGFGINASGQVAGYSTNAAGQIRAFRTTATGLISDPGTDLGLLPGGTQSNGLGINALGEVVGEATGPNGKGHAFLYTTQMWDLNNLIQPETGRVLQTAFAINDNGWITGESAANRGFLLIPADSDPGIRTPVPSVPEPSSLSLAAAASVVGWASRRRRTKFAGAAVTAA